MPPKLIWKMKSKTFLAALLTALAFSGCRQISRAPDFNLPSHEDPSQQVTLSAVNQEHPVLLVFWASWCPSCVDEIPVLNEWQEAYQEHGLRILSVNVRESSQEVADFIKRYPVKYPVLMDSEGAVANRYALSGLPVSLFLAKGGEILYYGFSLPPNLETYMEVKQQTL